MLCDVLVVEDDDDLRSAMVAGLEREGLRVGDARDAVGALGAVRSRRPLVMVLDMMLDGGATDASGLVRSVRAEECGRHCQVILVSGARDLARHAARLGAIAVVPKPFTVAQLMAAMRHLFAPTLGPHRQVVPAVQQLAM